MRCINAFHIAGMTATTSNSARGLDQRLATVLSTHLRYLRRLISTMLFIFTLRVPLSAESKWPVYFDLGPQLVEEFQGTYEFKYKRVEFDRADSTTYIVRSSGDESLSEDKLTIEKDRIYWILGSSGEKWIALKSPFRQGDQWKHALRGWNQRYHVKDTDILVSVPAGKFEHCAIVTISWVAHEHDMEGPQKKIIYLAPHLGIIKREDWSGGTKEHEEFLTSISTGSIQERQMGSRATEK